MLAGNDLMAFLATSAPKALTFYRDTLGLSQIGRASCRERV